MILGQAEIRADGIRLTPDAERQFALALYVCANAGREIPRDEVAGLLWSEPEVEASRHCLRQALYRLRALGMPVRTGLKSVSLDAALLDADYVPVVADGAAAQAFLAVTEVTVLPGYAPRFSAAYSRWVEEFRDEIGARLRRGLVRSIAESRSRGRYADVDRLARQCLSLDPLNEEATLALAEAVALSGGKAEALGMIERYEREIGSRPELCVPARILKSRVSDLAAEWGVGRLPKVPLVGREAEIEWLLSVLADVSRGSSRAVCLVGDGGIGKTALVEEFLRMASLRNAACVRVRCQGSDSVRPLSAMCDILSQLLTMRGALGASPGSLETIRPLLSYQSAHAARVGEEGFQALDRRQVFEAAADLMDAVGEESLLIVFVDDVHWIDDESIRLLSELPRRFEGRSFMLMACARPPIDESILRWPTHDHHAESRHLKPLRFSESKHLVSLLLEDFTIEEGRLDDLLRLAGGNPLFLVELTRRTRERPYETLPENLRGLLDARISSRSGLSLIVLQACCVLGKQSSVERLERLLELPAFQLLAALNELEGSALIGREGDFIQCRHDLIASAAERTIQPSALMVLQKRAAHLLEQDALSTGDPALLWQSARYWEATKQFDDLRRVLETLGDYLMRIGSAQEASQVLERAIQYCHTAADRMLLLGRALKAYRMAGDWNAIARTVERRKQVSTPADETSIDDDALLLEALFRSSATYNSVLTLVVESMQGNDLPSDRHVILAQRGMIVALNALDGEAATRIYRTLEWPEESDLSEERNRLTTRLIYETACGRLAEAVRLARFLLSTSPDAREASVSELQRIRWTAVPLRYVGDFQEASSVLELVYTAAQGRMWTEAFEACIALTTVNVAASNPNAAHAWLQHAAQSLLHVCQDSAASMFYAAEVRVALCLEDTDRARAAMERVQPVYASSKGLARPRTDSLGLKVATEVIAKASLSDTELTELLGRLRGSLNLADHDISVFALARALRDTNRLADRTELLSHYRGMRRETYAVPAFLSRTFLRDAAASDLDMTASTR